ncbi:MAG TPA: hypothetical protein PKA10_19785 [Selenomonadales bacterium]|nr:hypothetical protein [Selenomonadales bacterium]
MVEKKRNSKKKLPIPKLQDVSVKNIEARLLPEDEDNNRMAVKWTIDIAEHKSNEFAIMAKCEVGPENKVDFEVIIEYELIYKGTSQWTEDLIKERLDEFLEPCLSKNSLIVAQLTDVLYNSPIIIPPMLFRERESEQK